MKRIGVGLAAAAGVLLVGCPLFTEEKSSDLEVISRGERVEFKDHLTKDKYTLFVFGADW